ncbi:MAG: insulinase family protein [bacterium]|nr:insulinase family protein [bacterium]
MRPTRRFIAAMTVLSVSLLLSGAAYAKSLPSDARIITGKLDNGVTWMYRQHDNPPGKMALMMHVRTGSLNETESQRGLAHFMEHMMFNGSKHFPPGELLKSFESIGMEFGADINASTGFDRTAYMLFLPDAESATIDKGLMALSDYAFGASLLEEEIDKERGVILEEKRTGQDYRERVRDKLWAELYEGSRLARRLPIGTEEVISGAPQSEFLDFYRTWYRPENTTLILVGDAKPEGVIPLIEKWYGEYRATVPHRSQEGPELKPFAKERAIVVSDPELARCTVMLETLGPGRPPTVTTDQWRTEVVEYVGSWIVGRRCEEKVQEGKASFLYAGASVYSLFNATMFVTCRAVGEPDKWSKMLEEIVVEVNKGLKFGFTQRELDLAKKEILADAERSLETEPTRNARRMTFQYLSRVNAREPISSAAQELELHKEILPTISLDEVNKVFREHFSSDAYAYAVQMPEKEGVTIPAREDVLAAARAAWGRKLEAPRENEVPTDLLASEPTSGKIAEQTADPDLKITNVWLENGVRVHHRYMDYKKDSVYVNIALAGGRIEETAGQVGLTEVAALAVQQAATSRLTSTNIRDLMTGKKVSVRTGRGPDDAFSISISGSPKDLETGFRLVYALLTDGQIEQSAFDTWRSGRLQRIEQNQTNLRYKAYEATADLLSGGDPRRVPLTKEVVEAVKLAEAQAWYDRLCGQSPIEVAVVGDIERDAALKLVAKYVGSLSKRKRSAAHLDNLRRLARPTGPLVRRVEVETISPQATASAGFIGCEGRNVDDARALDLAMNIMDSRLVKRIREDLALVYSIGAFSSPSWTYADSGRFMAGSMCSPENASRLAGEVDTMFKEFAEQGPTAEELESAKLQIANNLDSQMREPSYWLGVLRYLDLHHRSLDAQKHHKEAFVQMTAEQVQRTFSKYCTPERSFAVTAVPAKTAQDAEEKATAEPAAKPAA